MPGRLVLAGVVERRRPEHAVRGLAGVGPAAPPGAVQVVAEVLEERRRRRADLHHLERHVDADLGEHGLDDLRLQRLRATPSRRCALIDTPSA